MYTTALYNCTLPVHSGLCFVNQSQMSFDLPSSLWLVHYASSPPPPLNCCMLTTALLPRRMGRGQKRDQWWTRECLANYKNIIYIAIFNLLDNTGPAEIDLFKFTHQKVGKDQFWDTFEHQNSDFLHRCFHTGTSRGYLKKNENVLIKPISSQFW